MGAVKINKLDSIFSKLVRERVNYTCENCGTYYPEGRARMAIHCSHYYSRRHQATRYHPDNAFAHCYGCHQKLGGDPGEFYRWYVERMGEGREELIREKANSIFKRTKADKEDLYKHMKEQHKTMLEKRANGETGRIEFDAFD